MSIGTELMLKLFSLGEDTKNKNRNVNIDQKNIWFWEFYAFPWIKPENIFWTMLGENDYYRQKYSTNIIDETLKKSRNYSLKDLELESWFPESKSICS